MFNIYGPWFPAYSHNKRLVGFFSLGDDITQQTGGRTRRPQPKARERPGSPIRPVSTSSTQKTALSTHKAADEHIDKTRPQSQTESFKHTA